MLFKKRTDYFTQSTSLAADGAIFGQTLRFDVTREFPIDSMILRLSVTQAGTAPTTLVETVYNLIKRVTVTVSDGARTRNVVDASGMALLEYARHVNAGGDLVYNGALSALPNGTIFLYIPIFFALPQVSDPISSMFLLPAPRFNQNIQVTIQTASKAEYSATAGSATYSNGDCSLIVHRREVNVPNWQYWDTELTMQTFPLVATGQQTFELSVPGAYTGILFHCVNSSTGGRANPFTTLGENRLQYLGNVIRRFRFEDIVDENSWSTPGASFTPYTLPIGVYYQDFLTDRNGEGVDEIGSALETNFLSATGARMQLLLNIGTTGVNMNVLSHRIFGDISALKMKPIAA